MKKRLLTTQTIALIAVASLAFAPAVFAESGSGEGEVEVHSSQSGTVEARFTSGSSTSSTTDDSTRLGDDNNDRLGGLPTPPIKDDGKSSSSVGGVSTILRNIFGHEKPEAESRIKASTTLNASTTLRDKRKKEMEEARDDRKEEHKEMMEEWQQKRDELRLKFEERKAEIKQAWVSFYSTTLINRFDAAIERLSNLSDRINSRIAKVETAGGDMTSAKAFMVTASAELKASKDSVASLSASIETQISATTTPATIIKGIKTKVEEVKNHLKLAHEAMVKAVASIKKGLAVNASSSTEVEASSSNH